MERRLAAIFVADVEGYSRLMDVDEVTTLTTLTSHRAILDTLISQHHGRIANTAGDSVLAEFSSAVDAVNCALAAQAALASTNESLPEERRLWFRIGVHVGDLMVKDGDLFGESVNIAARLQGLAEPGGVCLSATAYEYVRKTLQAPVDDLGLQQVKNIEEPVRTFAIKPSARATASPILSRVERRDRTRADKPSVAVLPFTNMGSDPAQLYFSDGITEDIITELARFRDFLVISRHSSFAFRDTAVDVREVGRVLNADYVVEGSVRRGEDRVRVTAQLINAASGSHLWAERYDRPMEDVFAIQDDIARGVVATVAQRIIEDTSAAARRRPPQDVRAYDLFLQGNYLTLQFTVEAQDQGQAFFERARELDPTFARAYTGLAHLYLERATDRGVGVPREQEPNRVEALRLAKEALARDPNDPRVQSTIGFLYLVWREFDHAEHHLDLARALNPNDPLIQMTWAFAQACFGRPEQGLPAAELAFRLNPLRPTWYTHFLSRILFLLRRYEEVATALEPRTREPPAMHRRDLAWLAAAYSFLGRDKDARRCAGLFLEGVGQVWRGDPSAGPAEYVDWLVDASFLRRAEDEEHLREGLRRAGLPA
jgi:TolB-like protein/class 3 adenylate cyclase